MHIGVGILSYNRPESLARCLASLFDCGGERVEVMVSAGKADARIDSVLSKYPVGVLQPPGPGIPAANNALLAHFNDFDAVFLVQDDIRFVRGEWLDAYVDGLAEIPYLAFFDPYYDDDPARPRHYGVNVRIRRSLIRTGRRNLWQCRKSPQGAFQAIGRKALEAVGYFDPKLGVYGAEHHDYWLRVCNAGLCPRDCFLDVENSAELLRIDFGVEPSLDETARKASYDGSEEYRSALYGPGGEGMGRTLVSPPEVAGNVIRRRPAESHYTASDAAPLSTPDHYVYPERLPVLCYHSVSGSGRQTDRYAVPRKLFEAQIAALAERFRFIRASDAFDDWSRNGRFRPESALLTFDDAYDDIANTAPFLSSIGARANVFVITGHVGGANYWDRGAWVRKRHLDWPDLRALQAEGWEIGSHGTQHYRLTALSDAELRSDLVGARDALRDALSAPVRGIAYPYGSAGRREADVAGTLYSFGFVTGGAGAFDWSDDSFRIRRIVVGADERPDALLARVDDYLKQAPDKDPVWRPYVGWSP